MARIYNFTDEPGSGDLPFIYSEANLGKASFFNHSHDYSEIIIISAGHGIHSTSFGDFPIRAGDVYVVHPGISHGFRESFRLEMINIGYKALSNVPLAPYVGFQALFVLEPMYREKGMFSTQLHLSPGQKLDIEKICRQLKTEMTSKKIAYKAVCTGLFTTLTALLCRFHEENSTNKLSDKPSTDPRDMFKLGRALVYLEDRYTEEFSIKELSQKAGYSVNHFTEICRNIYGVTPLQYILQQRLNLAAKLLREGERNVTEIASACGFDDPNYFSRLFRKKMGVSPRNLLKRG
jgi:AraC-like DNA-binding protein